MNKIYLTLLMYFFVQTIQGQYQIGIIPRVSPDKVVSQKIGFTELEIKYGSPSVNDRQIWGNLVPFNKVWRAGANNATTVLFRSDIELADMTLDSGMYSLFLIPKKNDKWTVIFNKVSKQWGAFNYNSSEDALRLEISPRSTRFKTERLIYSINQTGYKNGCIILAWDFIELEIPFEISYLADFEREIKSRATSQPEYIQWIPYIQGAEHLEQLKTNLDLANRWINKAERLMNLTTKWNEQFYPRDYVEAHLYWIKAKILAWENNFKEATHFVDLLKKLDNRIFYERKKEEIDGLYDSWLTK